jgi:hypothetical protein
LSTAAERFDWASGRAATNRRRNKNVIADLKSGGDGGSRAATMLGFTPAGNHALQLLVPTITMRVPPRHRVPVLHRFDGGNFQQFLRLIE